MSVYQALMLMLAFATFVVALLTFIFTFVHNKRPSSYNFGELQDDLLLVNL